MNEEDCPRESGAQPVRRGRGGTPGGGRVRRPLELDPDDVVSQSIDERDVEGVDHRTRLLAHPLRASIVERLAVAPGLNKGQLADEVGVDPSVAVYHVDRLDEAGVLAVFESPRGNEVVCFVADDADLWEDPATRILFGTASTFRVARQVVRVDRATTSSIAGRLDRSQSSTRYHPRKLADRRLVSSRRWGRKVVYRAAERLSEWWRRVGADRARALEG